VERSLSKVPRVRFAGVNLAAGSAFVVADEEIPDEILIGAIRSAGYEVSFDRPEAVEERRRREILRSLALAWAGTVPLMAGMGLHMAGIHVPLWRPVEAVLSTAVLLLAGRGILKGARIALTHAHANMDVLVSLGAGTAVLTSILAAAGLPLEPFGAVGAMILSFQLTGRGIETNLRDRAAKEVKALLALSVREARLVREDGTEVLVPVDALKAGMLLRTAPGERIPADGTVREGAAAVDESMLTGEPLPVSKGPGDEVTGGSLCLNGSLLLRADRVGEDSFLARMTALVREAQGGKVPIQALADRITGGFVPVVILCALVAGAFPLLCPEAAGRLAGSAARWLPWVDPTREGISAAIFALTATLVIACPCALGLATPAALVVGVGAAARKGLLIRNAEAIQTAREVRFALLDKTGTLTEGHPRVARVEAPREARIAAALLESRSVHPLARALAELENEGSAIPAEVPAGEEPIIGRGLAEGKDDGSEGTFSGGVSDPDPKFFSRLPLLEDFFEIAGEGVEGRIDGVRWTVGRPSRDLSKGGDSGSRGDSDLPRLWAAEGLTVVEIRREGVPAGWVGVADPIRPDSAEAVRRLAALGVEPMMATGDGEITARFVAERLGIRRFRSGLRPEEKLDWVRELQATGGKVLMAGDGINDAAALKGADVGVAVGSGTDLAVDSADIVLIRGGTGPLADAISIAGVTFDAIRQNLFWAFAYNLLMVPLAMTGLLHPAVAEAAMAFSSLSVLANSLRIRGRAR
jgi:Cu+-exporting ATPase